MTTYYDESLNDETFKIIISTCYSATLSSLNDPKRFQYRARTIGIIIYDMSWATPKWISVGSIRAKQKTPEHYHGRQAGGEEILKYVKRQRINRKRIDVQEIKKLVDKHRQVHFTSAKENNKLATMDRENWKTMYRKCGIKLIPYVKHQRYEVYSV